MKQLILISSHIFSITLCLTIYVDSSIAETHLNIYPDPFESITLLDESSVLVVPKSVAKLTLRCNASCPVEWRLEKFRVRHIFVYITQDWRFFSKKSSIKLK